jgi:hypothetical protein
MKQRIISQVIIAVLVVILGQQQSLAQSGIPYSKARTLNSPFECAFSSGFAGSDIHFEAKILGEDFLAIQKSEYNDMHFARRGGIGYAWMPGMAETPENFDVSPMKFNLSEIEQVMTSEMPALDRSKMFQNVLAFVEPSPDTLCFPSAVVPDIIIPDLQFVDKTADWLSSFRHEVKKRADYVDSLQFDIYLPVEADAKIDMEIRGEEQTAEGEDIFPSPEKRHITFYYGNDQLNATISESNLAASYNPPTSCAETYDGRPIKCELLTKTAKGYDIYVSGPRDTYPSYYVKIDDTMFWMSVGLKSNPSKAVIDKESLARFVDSFQLQDKKVIKTLPY